METPEERIRRLAEELRNNPEVLREYLNAGSVFRDLLPRDLRPRGAGDTGTLPDTPQRRKAQEKGARERLAETAYKEERFWTFDPLSTQETGKASYIPFDVNDLIGKMFAFDFSKETNEAPEQSRPRRRASKPKQPDTTPQGGRIYEGEYRVVSDGEDDTPPPDMLALGALHD